MEPQTSSLVVKGVSQQLDACVQVAAFSSAGYGRKTNCTDVAEGKLGKLMWLSVFYYLSASVNHAQCERIVWGVHGIPFGTCHCKSYFIGLPKLLYLTGS